MVIRNKGEEQSQELKLCVGECIHSWTLLELELSNSFVAHLKAPQPSGYIVWDSIINFNAKLGSLNSLLMHVLEDEELLVIWHRLNKLILKASKKRNEIAHSGYIGNSHTTSLIPYLSMAQVITNPKGLKRLTASDLRKRSEQFLDLRNAIQWLNTASLSVAGTKDLLSGPTLIQEIRKSA